MLKAYLQQPRRIVRSFALAISVLLMAVSVAYCPCPRRAPKHDSVRDHHVAKSPAAS